MNKETALFSLVVLMVLKGIFALGALIASIKAVRTYKRFGRMQKVYFWLASTLSVVALIWIASLAFLLTHQSIARMIPEAGWYFIIFASPAAAIAATSAIGMFKTNGVTSVQQIPRSS